MNDVSAASLTKHAPLRLGILASGRGSNAQAIHQSLCLNYTNIPPLVSIQAVVSNKASAAVLDYAFAHNLETRVFARRDFADRVARDAAIATYLKTRDVDLVVLAGYDQIIEAPLLDGFNARIVNIHPSLLPKFGGVGMVGQTVHQAVIDAGESYSGCTVHVVTQGVDEGPILGQARVNVSPDDTALTLAQRVLKQEHHLYAKTIAAIAGLPSWPVSWDNFAHVTLLDLVEEPLAR